MRLALIFAVASACYAGQPELAAWRVTAATFAVAGVVDVHSSRGRYELNPILGRGEFSARAATTSLGITGGVLVAQYLALRWIRRHDPGREKMALRIFSVINAGGTIAHGTVGAYNYGHPRLK